MTVRTPVDRRSTLLVGPLLVLVVVLAAVALRLVNLSSSPDTFHPTRQYAGLVIAKARFLEGRPGVTSDERAAVTANARDAPRLEPRILEAVVAAGYGWLGGERLWLAGAISTLLWGVGGAGLFLLARRLAGELAAWVAMAYFLFLPYGVEASRAFQPDPAMVAFLVGSLLAIVRYSAQPTRGRLATAIVLSNIAVLVKPVCVFILVAVFIALAVEQHGLRGSLRRPASFVYLAGGTLPAASYYLYGVLRGDQLSSFASSGFLPDLLRTGSFWEAWSRQIGLTVLAPMAVLAVAGVWFAQTRRTRAFLAGAGIGYLVYGMVFSYHIHTHDYYQLPLIPIVGLGLGVTVEAAVRRVRRIQLPRPAAAVALAVAVLFGAVVLSSGVRAARREAPPAVRLELALAPEVGKLVGHSTRTVMLSHDYGLRLSYAGNLGGSSWPQGPDVLFMALQGLEIPTAAEMFTELTSRADWFVVTAMEEFGRQPALQRLLACRARLVAVGEGYRLYNLTTGTANGNCPATSGPAGGTG